MPGQYFVACVAHDKHKYHASDSLMASPLREITGYWYVYRNTESGIDCLCMSWLHDIVLTIPYSSGMLANTYILTISMAFSLFIIWFFIYFFYFWDYLVFSKFFHEFNSFDIREMYWKVDGVLYLLTTFSSEAWSLIGQNIDHLISFKLYLCIGGIQIKSCHKS